MPSSDLREFRGCDRAGEALDAVVARVHLEEEGGRVVHRGLEVGRVRAVGGADLRQPAARARHDVRDAEAAADLDEFPAGYGYGASEGQGVEREQHRGGVVVDDRGRLGAGQEPESMPDDAFPVAAPAGPEVVLEGDGSRGRVDGGGHEFRREYGPAEVGVDDRPGQVEDAPVAMADVAREPGFHRLRVARGVRGPVRDLPGPRLGLQPAYRVLDGGQAVPGDGLRQGRVLQHGVDARQGPAGHRVRNRRGRPVARGPPRPGCPRTRRAAASRQPP